MRGREALLGTDPAEVFASSDKYRPLLSRDLRKGGLAQRLCSLRQLLQRLRTTQRARIGRAPALIHALCDCSRLTHQAPNGDDLHKQQESEQGDPCERQCFKV